MRVLVGEIIPPKSLAEQVMEQFNGTIVISRHTLAVATGYKRELDSIPERFGRRLTLLEHTAAIRCSHVIEACRGYFQ